MAPQRGRQDPAGAGGDDVRARRFPPLAVPLRMVADEPEWEFPAAITAIPGKARLRVWAASGGGHLAVLAEAGRGDAATVANSARHVHRLLAGRYPGSLVVIEHWPRGLTRPGAHWIQSAVTRGRPDRRDIWPLPPGHPDQAELSSWVAVNDHQIGIPVTPVPRAGTARSRAIAQPSALGHAASH
jgi:hypothetical protein